MLLTDALPILIKNNEPFVAYRLPKSESPVTMTNGVLRNEFIADQKNPCFVMVPFLSSANNTPKYFFSQKIESGWEIAAVQETKKGISTPNHSKEPFVTSHEAYKKSAAALIEEMKSGRIRKVVLSRVIEHNLPDRFHFGTAFQQLCQQHPDAFVYIMMTDNQLWLGATPETLLISDSKQASTMALAGTQKALKICPTKYIWPEKDREEHDIVSNYIHQVLHGQQVNHLRQHQTKTITAGQMAHLQTAFEFEIPAGKDPIDIAKSLHPTPAVCGTPKQQAFELIAGTEKHDRSFYTGFLGPSDARSTAFFVNLRCMQIIGQKAFIYVGGGLTAFSDPQNEWDETVLKSNTMLSVIQNNS